MVSFGKNKLYSAIVIKIHNNEPTAYEVKAIEAILDEKPVVLPVQIRFWEWLSAYYLTPIGDVYRAALPSGLKLESENILCVNPEFSAFSELKPIEYELINQLSKVENLSIAEAAKLLNRKNIIQLVNRLRSLGAIKLQETISETYKLKTEAYIQLCAPFSAQSETEKAFELLLRSPKQEEMLMAYLSLSEFYSDNLKRVSKSQLLNKAEGSMSSLNGLIQKGILQIVDEVIGRIKPLGQNRKPIKALSELQTEALNQINHQFESKDTVLLHGVTSSGKTEIYIHLIQQALQQKKMVLYLLPEIALTTQIIDRLTAVFGDKIGVYHSKYSDAERVELWLELLKGEQSKYQVVLGVRSSIFLPFQNLGLIIVDEEHENTYKQYNPAPRYHARDAALILAQLHGAKTLLGTATPSIESYFNTQNNKYGLVELLVRHNEVTMPEIWIVDTLTEGKQKKMKGHFTNLTLDFIKQTIQEKKQSILFQNRRGYSPFVECELCGWVPQCEHCDVSLTYHKYQNNLQCHYCGYVIPGLTHCKACGSSKIKTMGFGTEKIEDEIQLIFPDETVARLDLDTTRKRHAAEELIHKFEQGDISILVGTQMVSKGLDFNKVGLVCILNADNMINFPDFRAEERSFQMMTQVSGRAGRRDGLGKVIIQTTQPKHRIVQQVLTNDFLEMYDDQIEERSEFHYPPFVRLIELTVKHKLQEVANQASRLLVQDLLQQLPQVAVLGPQAPVVSRVQNLYHEKILIKLPKVKALSEIKNTIWQRIDAIKTQREFLSIVVAIDVDPY